MLYAAPSLGRAEREVLARIDEIRPRIRFVSADRAPTTRSLLASFFSAESDDVVVDPTAQRRSRGSENPAFAGYRDAIGYVLALHDDPHFVYHESLLKSLHYMTLAHDPDRRPGRWRTQPIRVQGTGLWEVLYEPPAPEAVPELMAELMATLNESSEIPTLVRAALAHLDLVQIHPFADGNGRIGRALQTLVIVRAGILDPEFSSLEWSIARDRDRYRESIAELGPAWDPRANTRPFVRFCLRAHLHQAERALARASRMSAAWTEAASEVTRRRLPERVVSALADAALTGAVEIASYRWWAGISGPRARADLEGLVEGGWLRRRAGSRRYEAGPRLRAMGRRIRASHPEPAPPDPFR